jgi:hypothetical protein
MKKHRIVASLFSAFSANFLAGKSCGFFSVKRKLCRLGSALKQLFSNPYLRFHSRDSHATGVKPRKCCPHILDHCQSGRVAVAAVVKVARAEAIEAAAPQQRKALPAKIREERRKVRDDQGSETSGTEGRSSSGKKCDRSDQINSPGSAQPAVPKARRRSGLKSRHRMWRSRGKYSEPSQ